MQDQLILPDSYCGVKAAVILNQEMIYSICSAWMLKSRNAATKKLKCSWCIYQARRNIAPLGYSLKHTQYVVLQKSEGILLMSLWRNIYLFMKLDTLLFLQKHCRNEPAMILFLKSPPAPLREHLPSSLWRNTCNCHSWCKTPLNTETNFNVATALKHNSGSSLFQLNYLQWISFN